LAGLPPFYSEEVQTMYKRIMTQQLHVPEKLGPDVASLLHGLLERDPAKRLSDPAKIKAHPYFKDMNWEKLARLEVTPPYIPPVQDEQHDTSQISPEFLNESPVLSVSEHTDLGEAGHFPDFTYTGKTGISS
jgi:serum/glucocorticoid-regulated kinase 2